MLRPPYEGRGGSGVPRRDTRRARLGVLVGAGLAVVAFAAPWSCGIRQDAGRARTCRRALPAIVPPDARAEVLRIAHGPGADRVRVDYRLTGLPQADSRQRWIVCSFGPGTDLDAVTTESGPLSGPSVYLLKHYYLDTPEAVSADPGGR